MSETYIAGALRGLAASVAAAFILLTIAALPAAAEPATSIAAWEKQLDQAGAASDYERAAELMTGPVIEAAKPGVGKSVAKWLEESFGEAGFRADTISIMSTAEKGERRLYALYQDYRYAFMFIVFHKREEGWYVLNFSLEPNYPAIRQRF